MNSLTTKKAFRELLNREDAARRASGKPEHRNFQFRQRTRLYGDYLYAQDREKFNANYHEWLADQQATVATQNP